MPSPLLQRVICFLSGAVTTLAFAPVDFYVLGFLTPIPLMYFVARVTAKNAMKLGFCWGAGLFLSGTYWLYISIHIFGKAPLILALALMLALVALMAFYYALMCLLAVRLGGDSVVKRILLFPALWVLFELLRGWLFTGFPWMTLGYSQIDSPLSGFAPIVGVYGLSFIQMLMSACLLILVTQKSSKTIAALCVFGLLLPCISGYFLQSTQWTEDQGAAIKTTIVQGGVSQDLKWQRDQFTKTLSLYAASLGQHADSDVLVWPEVALPAIYDQIPAYIEVLESTLDEHNSSLLFGILERPAGEERIYNSLAALSPNGLEFYQKRHLVPFGEYFPVPDFVREWMRLMSLPYSDISAGAADQSSIALPQGLRAAVMICYEDAYPWEQRHMVSDAGLIVNISNDAWFGESIAPHQHLQIARMRALESGRPVIRATNNGVSAFIDHKGGLSDVGPQFRYATLTTDIQPRSGLTPYLKLGEWPTFLLCLLATLLLPLRKINL